MNRILFLIWCLLSIMQVQRNYYANCRRFLI